ncbi:MAG: hypothetical protein EOM51_10360 [Clostridia bacterium]|nr:hypothetical protein [Clostridia bacterium]NCC66578.1 hypothetical protein [Clostridia bacterium]
MDAFLKYFYQDMGLMLQAFLNIFVSIFNFLNVLLNYPMRMKIIKSYSPDFGAGDWVLLAVTNLLILAIIVMGIFMIVKLFKRLFRFRLPVKENEKLRAEVAKLSREVFKLNYEKDKILAMKVSEMGMAPSDVLRQIEDEENKEPAAEADQKSEAEAKFDHNGERNTITSPPVVPEASRFFRLTTVDNYYKTVYEAPVYDNDVTLEGFCIRYRNFAASKLRLFYDIDILRYFVAALGACRLIILQGISGTGKTSLPYSFGKYLLLDSTIAAVQPAWRDRTELFGYFNEFTKVFNETEFLRAVYEANYFRDPHVIVLDEMNIARVEYYFAEMLSVLEMPRPEEWLVDIVTTVWDNDPCLIDGGKVHINKNTWFVGTINNDDSTFAVADKVYDRAIPIDLDSKAASFIAPDTEPIHVTAEHLIEMFKDAKKKYPISEENLKKLDEMDLYVIKHFRLAFGNRIMKQLKDFVPCYVACGGTELDGIDFMVAKKILRKFESLNMGFIKDELHKFVIYLEKTFGKTNMRMCKEYLNRLQKMS